MTTDDSVWYLARDGKQHGPLSHVEISKLVELGHLRATDLVWRPGFADWRPAPSVFDMTPPAPKPAPVQPAPAPAAIAPEPARPSEQASAPSQAAPAAAPRAEPSFAGLSMEQPAAAAAAPRFEFPRPKSAPTDAAPAGFGPAPTYGDTATASPSPQPAMFDTGMFRPTEPRPQFGSDEPLSQPGPEPFALEPMFPETKKNSKGRGIGIALGLLVAVGGVAFGGYTYRDQIMAAINGGGTSTPAELPVVEAPSVPATQPAPTAAADPSPPAPTATPVVAAAEPQSPATPPAPGIAVTPAAVEIETPFEASPFWSYAKTEFPDWYADRMREVGEMKAANQPATEIDRKLVDAIVVMRRQNASKALAASPQRLKEIAENFVANLSALESQSVDACYEFIEKGETTPAAAALVQKPAEGAPLHAQLRSVFAAVVEGKQSPVTRTAPQPSDYNLLAAELGTIGWSQADIQLFADPKALASSPRDRVCKMVKEWFNAHLAVKDEPARERLLHETLRLVIAS